MAWSASDLRDLGGLIGGAMGLPAAAVLAVAPARMLAVNPTGDVAAHLIFMLLAAGLFYCGLFLGAAGGRWTVAFLQRLFPKGEEL